MSLVPWNAGLENRPHSVLFDENSTSRNSHVFTVDNTAYVVRAFDMEPDDLIEIDMVVVRPTGNLYAPLRLAGGRPVQLTKERPLAYLPFEGQFRARMTVGELGLIVVTATPSGQAADPTSLAQLFDDPVQFEIGSPNSTIVVTDLSGVGGLGFEIDIDPEQTAIQIAATPAALDALQATETARGVAELATLSETLVGIDTQRIVTAKNARITDGRAAPVDLAAANDAMFAEFEEGSFVDLKGGTYPVTTLPAVRAYNGAFSVGGVQYPAPHQQVHHPLDGQPRMSTDNTGIDVWPIGLWTEPSAARSETRLWRAVLVSNGHDAQRASHLNLEYSEDGTFWIGKRTIFGSATWRVKNNTMFGALGGTRSGGFVTVTDGSTEKRLFIYSDNNWVARTLPTPLPAQVVVDITATTPAAFFPHVGIKRWPAIAGGHDTDGWQFIGYVGGQIYALRTADNGANWTYTLLKAADSLLPNNGAYEPCLVETPHGYVLFVRTYASSLHTLPANLFASTAPLDMSTWTPWVDTGAPLANNVPFAIYENGNVYTYLTFRENATASIPYNQENTVRVYVSKASELYASGGVLPTAFHLAMRLPKSATGYFHSVQLPSGGWFSHVKCGEDILASTAPATGQICTISTEYAPADAFGRNNGAPLNLMRNPHFDDWLLGTSFPGLTVSTETANQWFTNHSGAIITVSQLELTDAQRQQLTHNPRFALLLDTTGGPDDFAGLYQRWVGEEAKRLILGMQGRGLVTLAMCGVKPPPPRLRLVMTFNYGTGGSPTVSKTVLMPQPYVEDDGVWEIEQETRTEVTGDIVWGDSPSVTVGIDCDSSATGYATGFCGVGIFLGRAPEFRTLPPRSRAELSAIRGKATLVNGANANVVLPEAGIIELTGLTADATVSGIVPRLDNVPMVLVNATLYNITFQHENVGSLSTNRFSSESAASVVVPPKGALTVLYGLATASRWGFLGKSPRGAMVRRQFTASGTWTKPVGLQRVIVWGTGAGAGTPDSVAAASQIALSGGGGAGTFASKSIEASALADTETVTIGAAGTAASNAGGNTSFGSHVTMPGAGAPATLASGTTASTTGVGTLAASATGADWSVRGNYGQRGRRSSGTDGLAGNGASSFFGTGGVGAGPGGAGLQAVAYGAGAGGSCSNSGSTAAGASGGAGVLFVDEYY